MEFIKQVFPMLERPQIPGLPSSTEPPSMYPPPPEYLDTLNSYLSRDIYYAKYYGKGGGEWSAREKNEN